MNRRRKNNVQERNINLLVLFSLILIVGIAFVLSYVLYGNSLKREAEVIIPSETQEIAQGNNNMLNLITENENSQEVSTSIGKTVEEQENQETTNKMAVNTSKQEEETKQNQIVTENNKEEDEQNNEKENVQNEPEEIENITKDPSFIAPSSGEIIKDYSKDNLVYSNTLEEWTTHLGIDYEMQKTDVVKAAAAGTIKSIKNDPRYGLTVVIEHENGFESSYSSLLTAEFVTVGENVEQGQTIATVGNTAIFEVLDTTHLHFEITKDGENVDPNIYIR